MLERRWNLWWSLLCVGAMVAAGCGNDLAPSDDDPVPGDDDDDVVIPGDDDDDGEGGIPSVTGNFTHTVTGEGDAVRVTTVVDATDAEAWQHLDLDTGYAVDPGDEAWDLSFSRFRVRVNGGLTGDGNVEVAALSGTPFEDVTMAPTEGWTSSWEDGDADDDAEPDNVFNNGTDDWYDYDVSTHSLTPRVVTYVVASTDGGYYKLAFDDYYDEAGTPAVMTFRWAEVAPPDGETPIPDDALVIDASDRASWVYLSVAEGQVAVDDPAESLAWDIAIRRTSMRTNSGTSGPGIGGAREDDSGLPFESVSSASTFGFVVDEVVDSGRPGVEPTSVNPALGGWFDYDPTVHLVTPGDRSYLLRTADGGYAKLRVWAWDDGEITVSIRPVDRRIDYPTLTVDASTREEWTYVSLTGAAVLEEAPEDPANDLGWDLAFSRTRIRTNGGTSGAGLGGALELEGETNIVLLTELPAEGYVVDEPFAEGPPGAPEVSSSRVLGGWYDYNPTTHTVSVRETVYAVRTADGDVGALQVDSYEDGTYEVTVSFPGPDANAF